jgi:hypothetical protein
VTRRRQRAGLVEAEAAAVSAPSRRGPARRDRGAQAEQHGNAQFDWHQSFDSKTYVRQNYLELRGDDREILTVMSEFFAEEMSQRRRQREVAQAGGRGIDVGSGANLYPALSMLPYCETVTCWEPGQRNCDWLRQQIREGYSEVWDQYWAVLHRLPDYAEIGPRARDALRSRGKVVQRSVFELPTGVYDIGTMFFVAESITNYPAEFSRATQRFVRSLRPNAPFAAAFMRKSRGYFVGDNYFPAVEIDESDVRECLKGVTAEEPHCEVIGRLSDDREESAAADEPESKSPLRSGYDGMILALGRAGSR